MDPPRPFMDGPFRLQMGLRALDVAEWLDRSADALAQIPYRRRLLAERADEVMLALEESRPAQAEAADLIVSHLTERHPDQVEADEGVVRDRAGSAAFALEEFAAAPLALAGRLVAEDLCLMEAEGDAGYRLTAGVLCFPLHWSLRDKLGRPIDLIHEPVPGFEERLSVPVDRFFRKLEPARPVWRANWSLVDTTELFLPPAHRGTASAFDPGNPGGTLWLRTERQTLRRLPRSRAILFTIRSRVEPLETVVREPGVAGALAARIREMPAASARYKGILPVRDGLIAYLDGLSSDGSVPSGLSATG